MRNRLLLFFLFVLSSATAVAQEAEDNPADSVKIREKYPIMDYSTPKRYVIKDIRAHGLKYIDNETLIAVSGLQKGDEVFIPGDYVSRAIKNFWNQRRFSEVEVDAQIEGDSIIFDLYFTERPMVYSWRFEGTRSGEAKTFVEDLGLKRVYEYSDFIISKNANVIKEKYIEKGYRNVTVDHRVENDSLHQNAVIVTLLVDKGNKVKVGKINIEGNEVFSDGKLRRTFKKTHQKSFNFFKSAKFKAPEYEEDKELMVDMYNSKGYRNANIVRDSIYDINPKRMGIDIEVEEGDKFYFRNITWVGNSVHGTDYLQQLLGVRKGETYDKKTLHKRLGVGKEDNPEDMSVKSLYQNDGYLFSQIDPSETVVGADSIDLEIKIYEGKQATINEVGISGNLAINDEVIRRELYTRPGDLYNRSLLMRTVRQLAQMEHFEETKIFPDVDPVTPELVNLAWPLVEKGSDQFNVSGGWGTGMFVGSVGVKFKNFSLKNMFNGKEWRPYPRGQNQQLSLSGQSNGSYYNSFSVSFTEPWLGGRKPNALTVGFYYSNQSNAYYMWQEGTQHFRTIGGSAGVGRRLNWPDPYFTLYTGLSYQAYILKDWDGFLGIKNGTANILALSMVFGRNSVDRPLFPTQGSDFSLSLDLTPPYSLFDGKDYSDPNLSNKSRYGWIEYHKWKLKSEWYYPLTKLTPKGAGLVLMAKAEMGYLGYYNTHKRSPFEGFEVGGDGMSGYNIYGIDIISMRGYENGALTPMRMQGEYANVYNKYTMELRYPFLQEDQATIYGLVFAEAGNAWNDWRSFNPFQVKRSLGAGIRLFLPMIGMLGVDWGYGFDKIPGSDRRSGGQIHYMIGQQF